MKLLVREADSELIADATADAEVVVTSSLTYVEARAALARMHELGRRARPGQEDRLEALNRLWANIGVVPPSEKLIKGAGDLCGAYVLRAFDAVQLASCQASTKASETVFACWSQKLRQAATAEGLALLPA